MKRINIGPDELESFLLVAELGSFRGAAERLGVSQPAITNRIRRLENVLGAVLFTRTTRRVALTEAGQRLQARAEETVANLRATVEEFRDEALIKRGHVTVAAAVTMATSILPPLIRRFALRHPNIHMSLIDGFDNSLLDRLRDGSADLAILPFDSDRSEFKAVSLFEDEILLIVPRDHVLANNVTTDLSTVANFPFVSSSLMSPTWMLVAQAFKEHHLELTTSFETVNVFTRIGLVEAGLGLTFLPRMLMPRLNLEKVTTLRVKDMPLTLKIAIVTLRDRTPSPAAAEFAKALRRGLKHSMAIPTA